MGKKIAPVIVLVAGGLAIAGLILSRGRPETRPAKESSQKVEVIIVETMSVVPRITTYGEVSPDRTWTATAQVPGQIAWKSPKLKNGEFVAAGEELLRIDDREFALAIGKANADIDKNKARLVELETNQVDIGEQLALLKEAVTYNETELRRQQNLYESKAVSASAVEQQRITVLEQQRTLAALQASHNILPAQIEYQKAELAAAEAALKQTELDLEHTVFTAPFEGRLDEVAAEVRQYVPAGQTLLKLDSIAEAEITIGVSQSKLAMLAGVRVEKVAEAMAENQPPPQRRQRFTVIVDNGNGGDSWEGRFSRMSASVDSATRMIEMVVAVDTPYQRPVPGKKPRPPLGKGTFCTVIMHGEKQAGRVVVPRQALHEGKVYVVDDQSRLEIRSVAVQYYFEGYAVLEAGLRPGESLVVSDIVPAVPGMLLDPMARDGFYRDAAREIGEEAVDA